MDPATRGFMEARFGEPFGDVRVHTGAEAGAAAQRLSALAFTAGRDVVFGDGRYRPESREGLDLVAHELAHVVQQRRGAPGPGLKAAGTATASPGPLEQAAAATARAVVSAVPTRLVAEGATLTARVIGRIQEGVEAVRTFCRAMTTVARVTTEAGARTVETVVSALVTAGEATLHEVSARVLDAIVALLRHPAVRLLPAFPPIAALLSGLRAIAWLLVAAYRIYQQAEPILRAIRTALGAMVSDALNDARVIAKVVVKTAALLIGGEEGRHLRGVWRHLDPKLEYMADHWWEVIRDSAWGMIWPWPAAWRELRSLARHDVAAARHLCDFEFALAYDELLAVWRAGNNLLGSLYPWFTIAAVLTGGVIGAVVGGGPPGFVAGAAVGWEVAAYAGIGLLASFVLAETLSIHKAAHDLFEEEQTPDEEEQDYEQIASSSLTLGITGAMVALGAIAARFARAVIARIGRGMWRLPALRQRQGGLPARGDVFEYRLFLARLVRGLRARRRVTWMERVRRNTPGFDLLEEGVVEVTPRRRGAPLYTVRGGRLVSSKSTQRVGQAAIDQIEGWAAELAAFRRHRNVRVVNPSGRTLTVAMETPLAPADAANLRVTVRRRWGVDLELTTAVPEDHPAFVFVDELPAVVQQAGPAAARAVEEGAEEE